ncbi:MAG: GreA/GreB family elongation factor [Verrucomicrobia bacterium]|nr:GreA/GreB family elongation factor [Verrucomicrobiota bacterium]
MNKKLIVRKIVDDLTTRAALHVDAARAAHAEATDEENKAEDPYDTRGLEAAYLAAGQSRQTAETERAIAAFKTMKLPEFGPKDPVDLGALVDLQVNGEDPSLYFIGPSAGGTEIVHEKRTILVITPQSPLGEQLVGRKQGDRLKIRIAGTSNEYRLLTVE